MRIAFGVILVAVAAWAAITPHLAAEPAPAPYLFAPESDDTWLVTQLGYTQAHDAFVKQDDGHYAFIIYTRIRKDGAKAEVVIRSNIVTGTSWTPERGNKMAADLERKEKSWRTWGEPFKAGPEDARRIEYRFHQKDGKPTKLEIFVVTRKEDRSANEPVRLIVDWPFEAKEPSTEPGR